MTTELENKETLAESLKQFYGTEHYYKVNSFFKAVATDGVYYFANKGGAFWALDEILLMRGDLIRKGKVRSTDPLFFEIKSKNSKATITCDDGNGNILRTKRISYTDLEAGTYKIYYIDDVLLLPSEY